MQGKYWLTKDIRYHDHGYDYEYYLYISSPDFELLGGGSVVLCNFIFLVLILVPGK